MYLFLCFIAPSHDPAAPADLAGPTHPAVPPGQ